LKAKILPLVLYGYKTWSLVLRKELSLRTFENRVLRRKFGQDKLSERRLGETAQY
jgi:hypothetical protein